MRRPFALLLTASIVLWAPAVADGVTAGRARPFTSSISKIDAATRARMVGSSWHRGCPMAIRDLRLLNVAFVDFGGERHVGKLVVHRRWAREIVHVFRELYDARFPIRRMRLVDAYGADDMISMRHDNTSAFNCRWRGGVCCTWSMHAYGKAVDIDPRENPYIGSWGVSPPNGAAYVDRTDRRPGMIFRHSRIWRAFHAIGWGWGGSWASTKDYQHFSSSGR
jgi:hypothetical protein